jgi:hypothetical protein
MMQTSSSGIMWIDIPLFWLRWHCAGSNKLDQTAGAPGLRTSARKQPGAARRLNPSRSIHHATRFHVSLLRANEWLTECPNS